MTHENKKLWSPVAVSPVESCYLQWGRDIEGVKGGGGGYLSSDWALQTHGAALGTNKMHILVFYAPLGEKKTSTAIFSNTTGQAAADRMYPAKPWSFKVGFDVCLDE